LTLNILRARLVGQNQPWRAISGAGPAALALPDLADFADSASAAIAITLLGAEDAPAGSVKSGRKARCGIMRASTS
jgi:hypothetical protein